MNSRLRKLAVTITITAILLSCVPTNIKLASADNTGGKIDLFTQKEPGGKGPNVPSDAFGPGEEVQIYALVTYNEEPVQNFLVSFKILGSKNPVENITFYRVASTNEAGIATMSFRISHINETTFGEWAVIGNTTISDLTFQDSVVFKVGWIVEIVSMKTINKNYMDQEKFTRGSYVGIELVLRNIAMTEKKITVVVAIYDCLSTPLNSTEIEDFEVQENGNTTAYFFLYIPKKACVSLEREAIARACIYPVYCPEVSKPFFITNHDIAIFGVQPSPTVVYRGETVNIDVTVKNKGLESESFNLRVYYNKTIIGVSSVDLQPGLNKKVSFIWNTSCVEEGLYRISACVEPVPGEIDTLDNVLTYDFVEVRAALFLLTAALSFLLAMFVCFAAIVFVLLRTLEKKKKGQPVSSEVKNRKEFGFKRSKTCNVCGKEFPEAYTFCPYCFTFHGKDYK